MKTQIFSLLLAAGLNASGGGLTFDQWPWLTANYEAGVYDQWFLLYPDITIADQETDTDGDGLSDLLELILHRNPHTAGPPPLTEEEKAALRQKSGDLNQMMKVCASMRADHFTKVDL